MEIALDQNIRHLTFTLDATLDSQMRYTIYLCTRTMPHQLHLKLTDNSKPFTFRQEIGPKKFSSQSFDNFPDRNLEITLQCHTRCEMQYPHRSLRTMKNLMYHDYLWFYGCRPKYTPGIPIINGYTTRCYLGENLLAVGVMQ